MSSPQRAKLTKMRLERETVTPWGMGPLKVATVSRLPKVWSAGVLGGLAKIELWPVGAASAEVVAAANSAEARRGKGVRRCRVIEGWMPWDGVACGADGSTRVPATCGAERASDRVVRTHAYRVLRRFAEMANQMAVVTGASSGIGYNLAKVFAENGFDLVIASNGDRLEKAAADFGAMGVQVKAIEADLATYDGVKSFWSQVESLGRPVDAAAINAGVGVGGLFAETDLDEEINLIRLNVEGTVHITKRVVQHMVKRGQGKILITASIAGEMVAPREAVYAASKAFDLSFAKSLRVELEGTGVTVTALQPGPVDTDFFHRAGMDDTKGGARGQ